MVKYDGVPHYVRLGFNAYMKQCCSDFMHRLEINNNITAAMRNCPMRNRRGVETRRLYARCIPPPQVDEVDPEGSTYVWTYPASDCRDPYTSLFTNAINDYVGVDGQRDRATLLECLYTLPLTPSQEGWFETFQATCSKRQPGENFVLAYIENAVQNHGAVTHGTCPRIQPSVGVREIPENDIIQSLRNLDKILVDANSSDNTKAILKKMIRSPSNGGLYLVGDFWAQVLLRVAIKLGLVSSKKHHAYASVATSTETFNRLRQHWGVTTSNHAAEIIPFLSHKLKLSQPVCENKLCEFLRHKHGVGNTKDVFVRGHMLHRALPNGVYKYDLEGVGRRVKYGTAKFRAESGWWESDYEVSSDKMLTLTRRKRSRKRSRED
jgi:hypothetical protein